MLLPQVQTVPSVLFATVNSPPPLTPRTPLNGADATTGTFSVYVLFDGFGSCQKLEMDAVSVIVDPGAASICTTSVIITLVRLLFSVPKSTVTVEPLTAHCRLLGTLHETNVVP